MAFEIIDWLALVLGFHLALGFAFGLVFATRLVGRLDPDARQGTWGFRLAILPGVVVLWPFLVARLKRGGEPRERGPHYDALEEAR